MRIPNYNRFPSTIVDAEAYVGWNSLHLLLEELIQTNGSVAIELYPGVDESAVIDFLKSINLGDVVDVRSLYKCESEIKAMTEVFLTDDVLFGYISPLTINDYIDELKLNQFKSINKEGRKLIVGTGASVVADKGTPLVYFDLSRWEIIQRFRRNETDGIGVLSRDEPFSFQYKRGYFNDWKIADRLKEELFSSVSYWVDTHNPLYPVTISHNSFIKGIEKIIGGPFRVVPFFDAAPWGGQWMKEKFGLPEDKENYGWGFDCVPEENSILFDFNGVKYEFPAVNLVLLKSKELLGEPVEARFGKDFPIRFDFLDTVGGGNLSLQVHPTIHFSKDHFGLHYTQDESYYIVDAKPGSEVYLGLKDSVNDGKEMFAELESAQSGKTVFNAEKFVNTFKVKKHDHFLIPSGTIHCSGTDSVVLEISSTPNLFTFKLWDWGRLGLDGKPRPINIDRGKKVINLNCTEEYTINNLINKIEKIAQGEGWIEEKTGLHPSEFIEVRRHKFTSVVSHHTGTSVNVLNLVEGEEIIVESPTNSFAPYIVHYGETFIIPASIGAYTIRPYGVANGTECITVKAFVRV